MTPIRWTRVALVALVAVTALAFLALVIAPRAAQANGVPVVVDLAYIDLSNWGPEDATGTLELLLAEGIVRVDATGLPRLLDERYQGWLVNSQSNNAISVGRFNAMTAGDIAFQGSLPPIADFGFDLFIITVEPEPDDAPQPAANRSIGGYFSLIGHPDADGENEAALPGQLPNTGAGWLATDVARIAMLGGVMALSVVIGMRLSRRPA